MEGRENGARFLISIVAILQSAGGQLASGALFIRDNRRAAEDALKY